jgi:hypothetical protein
MGHVSGLNSNRIRSTLLGILSATVLLPAVVVSSAGAVTFKIIAPLQGKSRPDLPCCIPFYLWGTPVISGNYVVFATRNFPPDGIWSYNITSKAVRKLAGFGTDVPGGTGKFTAFFSDFSGPTIGGAVAVFYGTDQAGVIGLYSVRVNGGPIRRIASTRTRGPDGKRYTVLGRPSSNGSDVVFYGQTTDPKKRSGIYRTTVTGGPPSTVIDNTMPLDARVPSGPVPDYFEIFLRGVLGQTRVAFSATGVFDPSTGANAIFQTGTGFKPLADNMTPLPGNPNADTHIVVVQGFSASNGSEAVAFYGAGDGGYRGIFKARNRLGTGGALVTNETLVPGTARKFTDFAGFGYDNTGLAFAATDPVGSGVYFTDRPGGPVSLVARHGPRYYFPIVGDRSVSNGRIVFSPNSNFGETFYLATPRP